MSPAWHTHLRNILRKKKPLIVIVGPTASGKTSFSIDCCQWLRAQGHSPEIINADSRQLYRKLSIGTAKIKKEEMEDIPHHLFDVLDPDEDVTIAWYQKEAHRIIEEIHQRSGTPVLVGGSMLYVSSIVDGLEPKEAGNPFLRGVLGMLYDEDGGEKLHARLTKIDPESAASIPKENKVYLIRALELYELTGETKSSLQSSKKCPYDLAMIGVTRPRPELKKRISERIEQMFADGWIDEVKTLIAEGYDQDCPALESHGYREIAAWIGMGEREGLLPDIKAAIAKSSTDYAKRQMTWWKRDERIVWI